MPKAMKITALLLAGVLAFLGGCGGGDSKPETVLRNADGVLGYVPADTPYVFATPEKMPEAVLDKLEASADAMYSAYATLIEASLGDAALEITERGGDEEQAELILALAKEFSTLMQSDNLRAAGVPRSPQIAFYGVGLLPVLRVELSNPVAFDAKVAEIEANAGRELLQGEVDGTSYKYFGDDKAKVIIAVIDRYLVATIAPAAFADADLAEVLGVERPARSIAESGGLAELAETYGYTAYGLGMIDVTRIAGAFLDDPAGTNAALFELGGYDNAMVSDVCRAEIREVAGIIPRVVSGYTRVTTDELASNTVFEVRPDIAAGLSLLAAPVPGLGTDHGGMGSFGVSLDLMAARKFVEERVARYDAEPFECEYFAGLGSTVAQVRLGLAQPVPPNAYSLKGLIAVLDRIEGLDIGGQQPPTDVDARLLVASDNAPSLLALGAMFSPELAALNLQPDGKPVELQLAQVPSQFGATWVAMTDSAIALSVGKGSPDLLEQLLGSAPGEPLPSVSMRLDAERYYQFMSEAVAAGNASSDAAEEVSPEVQQAVTQVMTGVGDMMERIAVDVVLTSRGIEVPSTITLAD